MGQGYPDILSNIILGVSVGLFLDEIHIFFYLFIYLFIYLFMAVLGLHCCVRAFSSCGEWGLLFVAVCGLLIVVASLCCRACSPGVQASVVVACGLSSCGSWALERRLSSCGSRA